MTDLSPPAKGTLAIIAAAVIWGFQPIFYGFLGDLPARDIAAHRILWSLVFFAFVLTVRGRLRALKAAITAPHQIGWTFLAAVLVSCNWFFFVYAIQTGRLTESSLGYYIYPLVSVALGAALFRERFARIQVIALGLVALGVLILTMGLGRAPLISLILALTFALYGVVKKRIATGPTVSVTAEVALLSPFVLVWILGYSDIAALRPAHWGLLM